MTSNAIMPSEMELVQILYNCRKVWERLHELDDIERTRIKNYFIKASDDKNIRYIAEYFTNKKTLIKNNVISDGKCGIGSSCIANNEIANPFTNSKNQLYSWNEANINTSFEECLRNQTTLYIIKEFSKFKFYCIQTQI